MRQRDVAEQRIVARHPGPEHEASGDGKHGRGAEPKPPMRLATSGFRPEEQQRCQGDEGGIVHLGQRQNPQDQATEGGGKNAAPPMRSEEQRAKRQRQLRHDRIGDHEAGELAKMAHQERQQRCEGRDLDRARQLAGDTAYERQREKGEQRLQDYERSKGVATHAIGLPRGQATYGAGQALIECGDAGDDGGVARRQVASGCGSLGARWNERVDEYPVLQEPRGDGDGRARIGIDMRRLARRDADLQRESYRNAREHQDVAAGAEKPPQPLSSG